MSLHRPTQRGAVLLGALLVIMLAGLATLTYTQSWYAAKQRDLEDELLFIGQQYQAALESYYRSSPGPVKHLPVTLEELVRDARFPQPVRHLRRLYADPLEPQTPWAIVRRGPQIVGIHSQASGEPIKRADFDLGLEAFTGARSYAAWQFLFVPRTVTPATRSPLPATSTKIAP